MIKITVTGVTDSNGDEIVPTDYGTDDTQHISLLVSNVYDSDGDLITHSNYASVTSYEFTPDETDEINETSLSDNSNQESCVYYFMGREIHKHNAEIIETDNGTIVINEDPPELEINNNIIINTFNKSRIDSKVQLVQETPYGENVVCSDTSRVDRKVTKITKTSQGETVSSVNTEQKTGGKTVVSGKPTEQKTNSGVIIYNNSKCR